jgi:hypothetical protein
MMKRKLDVVLCVGRLECDFDRTSERDFDRASERDPASTLQRGPEKKSEIRNMIKMNGGKYVPFDDECSETDFTRSVRRSAGSIARLRSSLLSNIRIEVIRR